MLLDVDDAEKSDETRRGASERETACPQTAGRDERPSSGAALEAFSRDERSV